MQKRLLRRLASVLALVLGAGLLVSLPGTANAATDLQVMSWNIRSQTFWGVGLDKEIIDNGIQIAGLQEVCELDVARIEGGMELETGVGWTTYFAPGADNLACLLRSETQAGFGNVILVRDDVGATDHVQGKYADCPGAEEHEVRSWQAVTVPVAGVNARFYNTHMDYAVNAPDCQIAKLAGIAGTSGAAIVMGDFNIDAAQEAAMAPLLGNGFVSAFPTDPTYFTFENFPDDQAKKPGARIDHILYRGLRMLQRNTPTWTENSDHRYLTAKFDAVTSDRADPGDAKLHWSPNAEGVNEDGQVETMQQVLTDLKLDIGTVNMGGVVRDFTAAASCGGSPTLPANATPICFSDGDNKAEEWIPQGITTNYDATGGSVSPILVTWYDGCDSGVQGEDWGKEYQGCQTDPTGTHRALRKGVQVSLYYPDGKYKNVLLVEPFNNSSNNPSFHATHMHAGGIAMYGRYLLVADTSYGFRVFDTQQIFDMTTTPTWVNDAANYLQVGRHDGRYYSHGYRYLMPAVGEYRLDAGSAPGGNPACYGNSFALKFSYMSIDRSTTTPRLVAGEYCNNDNDPTPTYRGRVARWNMGSSSSPASILANSGAAVDAFYLPVTHAQGVESRGDTFYFNTSNGQDQGVLHKAQRVGTSLTPVNWTRAAIGPEDTAYEYSLGVHRIYSLSEYYGRRAIYTQTAF